MFRGQKQKECRKERKEEEVEIVRVMIGVANNTLSIIMETNILLLYEAILS